MKIELSIVVRLLFVVLVSQAFLAFGSNRLPADPYIKDYVIVEQDTIKPRYGNFIEDPSRNPFDLEDPDIIEQNVDFDPVTGMYIISEKIGEEYYRMPTYMTMQEFLEWKSKQQESRYFNQLAGIKTEKGQQLGKIDPASYVNVKKDIIERLFGGNEITIKPQGSIDLTFGGDYQKNLNPALTLDQQVNAGFDFDMDIQMNVEGGIGDKLKLDFNYNPKASFDFDNQIKLKYDSEDFNEDAILKKIEAGNVSLPLRGSLIQGSQSLFGIKTELQFGHLRLTAIASQQRSRQKGLSIENGAVEQVTEIRPDEYDENRHFFLSHFNRAAYEGALEELPNVRSPFRITRMEVYVTNDRNETHELRNICAISYLGEGNIENYSDPSPLYGPNPAPTPEFYDHTGQYLLPDNRMSTIYQALVEDKYDTKQQINTATNLQSIYGMEPTRDFEILKARKLSPNEYTFHPELGFISLNIRLRPDQVLGVAYEYTYTYNGDEIYTVGEFNERADTTNKVMYVKMLKSKNQRVDLPSWRLMMKNVYSIGAPDVNQEDFKLDIFYEDLDGSLKRFIPEESMRNIPLLNVFNLDNLSASLDPQPDGIFDYVPGLTIIPRTGSVIFPVLEPFGQSLEDQLTENGVVADNYVFHELYDTSITEARKFLEKNKFVMKAEYKSSVSSEISLGAWNIPRGSVRVTAGGRELVEGADYDIDYGTGRLKILNKSVLQSGRPVNVSFEDNSLYSFTQKNMLGLRADYDFNPNFNMGATYLHLFERPFTEKVNLGDDPINNRIYGLDLNYARDVDWLTRAIDKLPLISTKAPSNISFTAEVAALQPGHSSAINNGDDNGGVVSIDDFEGTATPMYLDTENEWVLASTPTELPYFPEGGKTNDLAYGANRALLNWYIFDRTTRSSADNADPYTRLVLQQELFERDIPQGNLPDLRTFDFTYYPEERGPYNFDTKDGIPGISAGIDYDTEKEKIVLKDPESRWGGAMRYIDNNDFEALNVEYIEFWMLNPYMDRRDPEENPLDDEEGEMVIHLGNVSEDILRDNIQFYENALPTPGETVPLINTAWGRIPTNSPLTDAFDADRTNRNQQDVGYDGLTNEQEQAYFDPWITQTVNDFQTINLDELYSDPANDDWLYFDDESFEGENNLLKRYKKYNNPHGNFPDNQAGERRGQQKPDKEDLDGNKSLDQTESYYKYVINLDNEDGKIRRFDGDYITDERTIINDNGQTETWYRFQIPISEGRAVNGIQGYRSIQYMRTYFTKFAKPKTFRLAQFGFVRNHWRKSVDKFNPADDIAFSFNVDDVGLEENQSKLPFNYKSPPGIKQERLFSSYNNVRQDEKSIALQVDCLYDTTEVSIYKLTLLDARPFERIQLFVHAENPENTEDPSADGDVSLFIRLGKDFVNNYYEYSVPLKLSDLDGGISDALNIWKDENYINLAMAAFTDLKLARNASNTPLTEIFEQFDSENILNPEAKIAIKGNPSLGYIKGIQIGLKQTNPSTQCRDIEVWVNELRLNGLDESGGVAGLARLDVQLADLGSLTLAGNYSSIGWGALDQKLDDRSKEEVVEYDLSGNLELGRFFPSKYNVRIPLYAQYGQSIRSPKYDPYDLDLTVEEKIATYTDQDTIQAIKDRALDMVTVKTLNLTNVSVGGNKSKKTTKSIPKPWDISNVSVSYAYTNTVARNPILKNDDKTDQRLSLDYTYSIKSNYIKPFNKIAGNKAKFFKEMHFNPLPSSFSFNTELRRFNNQRLYREPIDPRYLFEDKRFNWDRNYSLSWNFTKDLRLSYNARNIGVIDEIKKYGVLDEYRSPSGEALFFADSLEYRSANRDTIINNLQNFGRTQNFSQNLDLTYKLPLKYIPFLSFMKVSAKYNASYNWTASSLNLEHLGNLIQNSQSRSVTADMDLTKLYGKWRYLEKIEGKKTSRRSSPPTRRKKQDKKDAPTDAKVKKESKLADRQPTIVEKILIRPLLSIRKAKFSYKEDLATVVPGFMNDPTLFGLSEGFSSPGWDFVFGLQPNIEKIDGQTNQDNWLTRGANNGWFTTDRFLSQQVLQQKRFDFSANIDIEPFKDFRVKVDFKKNSMNNHSEEFKNTVSSGSPVFEQLALKDVGSFEVTYFSMNTLFIDNDSTLFNRFSNYRQTISNRLATPENVLDANGNPLINPDTGEPYTYLPVHSIDSEYKKGFGSQSQQVLIPAFIAAYSGKDPNVVNLDLKSEITNLNYLPRPNWSIDYKGLSKLAIFEDLFSSFTIKHGYKSILKVNSFTSDLRYDYDNPFGSDNIEVNEQNYYSRLIIPDLVIQESFDPIIGIDVKTKNDMSFRFNYKKARMLLLSSKSLTETKSTEFVVGFTYKLEDVVFGKKNKKKKDRRSRDEEPEEDDTGTNNDPRSKSKTGKSANDFTPPGGNGGRGVSNTTRDMNFSFDFSYRDNITLENYLDNGTKADPTRGNLTIRFSPAVDYAITENLILRLFVDYNQTLPHVPTSFPITRVDGGLTVRFMLN
jgi:cell surface protein SprA